MHNNAFWSNSNAFSLIICKVQTKRENSSSWKSGPGKATSGHLFCTTPNKMKLYGDFLWNIWGILEPISTRGGPPGGHNPPGRAREPRRALVGCAHPGPPPVPIFWYISHFDLEKIRQDFRDGGPPSRGGTWAGALLSFGGAIPPGELPSRRGKSLSSSSPTTLPSWGGQSPSTYSIAPSPLKP